jgi:hypothetical protein
LQEDTLAQFPGGGCRWLGLWNDDRTLVLINDYEALLRLGQSGASAGGREGFQRLVAEVGLGQAGIGMRLEVSRSSGGFWAKTLGSMVLTMVSGVGGLCAS